jgi:hypothetical protein
VRDRVRRDYEQRLEHLTHGLRAHADTIGGKLAADRSEFATLTARATAAREALAEAELRHAVGEFESSRFEAERTRHASDLEAFDLSLSAVADRIARLEDVHAVVTRPPAIAADEPGTETEDESVVVLSIEDSVVISDLAPDEDVPEPALSIFDDPPPEPAVEAVAPEAAMPEAPVFGALSFRPSGQQASDLARPAAPPRSGRPAESVLSIGIPAAGVPPQFIRPGERLKQDPAVSAATAASDAVFGEEIVASGPVPEAAPIAVGRTLRCGECGAMNRPLEWYCEKCGAELTAV